MKTKAIKKYGRSALLLTATFLASSHLYATEQTDLVLTDQGTMNELALSGASGRGDLQSQSSDVNQNASLGDNKLTAAETGKNTIDGGSFDNLQGIAHVIQNSGNNVIIQDNTTFNIQFVDGGS